MVPPADLGIDFKRKQVNIKGDLVKINLWDTAGHQDYRMVTANFMKGCSSIIVVTDATRLSQTLDLEIWKETIEAYASENPPVFLMANKADLLKDEEIEAAYQLLQDDKMKFDFKDTFLVAVYLTRCLPKRTPMWNTPL